MSPVYQKKKPSPTEGVWLVWHCTQCAPGSTWLVLSTPLRANPFLPGSRAQGPAQGSGQTVSGHRQDAGRHVREHLPHRGVWEWKLQRPTARLGSGLRSPRLSCRVTPDKAVHFAGTCFLRLQMPILHSSTCSTRPKACGHCELAAEETWGLGWAGEGGQFGVGMREEGGVSVLSPSGCVCLWLPVPAGWASPLGLPTPQSPLDCRDGGWAWPFLRASPAPVCPDLGWALCQAQGEKRMWKKGV